MKRTVSIRLAITLLAFCLPLIPNSSAQEEKAKAAAAAAPKPIAAYRIDLSVREIEDGKRLNSRSYMLMAQEGESARARVGSEVRYHPTDSNPNSSYRNVGMNIDCSPREQADQILLTIHVEFSSVAPRGKDQTETYLSDFRTNSALVEALVVPGKPTVVGSMDEVVSNRRYEIEVTATKLK